MGKRVWHLIDFPSKLILLWVIISLITEIIALFFVIILRNNFLVYNLFSLLSLLLLGLYFNKLITQFNNNYFKNIYSCVIILLWIGSIYYQKSFFTLNSPLMIIEGSVIMIFSILSIEKIVAIQSNQYFKLTSSLHFWFAVIFLFYWCITILHWGLYKYFVLKVSWMHYLHWILSFAGIVVNFSIGSLFYLYPKLKQADAD
jgi:hypothetical protein